MMIKEDKPVKLLISYLKQSKLRMLVKKVFQKKSSIA